MSNYLAADVIEVVGTCMIVGDRFNGGYLDYVQLPRPNMEAQTFPRLCFTLCMFYYHLWLFL